MDPSSHSDYLHGFSNEQHQHILALIQQSQLNTTPTSSTAMAAFRGIMSQFTTDCVALSFTSQLQDNTWIIDSGATNHMISNKNLIQDIQTLPFPCLVTLPNGYKVKIYNTGSLFLNSDFILTNVLLIPSFQFNLISVPQLVNTLSCTVFFNSSSCFIQAPSLKRPLAVGKEANGLYVFHSTPTSSSPPSLINITSASSSVIPCSYTACTTTYNISPYINKADLFWHQRLGHMPFHKMKSISYLSDKIFSKHFF